MFCAQCGTSLPQNSKFCSRCGAPVGTASADEIAAGRDEVAASLAPALGEFAPAAVREDAPPAPADRSDRAPAKPRSAYRHVYWLLPALSLAISGVSIAAAYAYQTNVNREVERLHATAERLALDGEWKEALGRIELALEKRPDHPALRDDRQVLMDTILLDEKLESANEDIAEKAFDEALESIDTVREQLETRSGAVYELLAEKAAEREESVVVAQAKDEYPAKESIEQLTPLLSTLKRYEGEDAKQTASAIVQKIAELAHAKATEELDAKNFTAALSTVGEALQHDEGNAKLTELKAKIEAEQTAYVEAEQQRIQSAMEAASMEDLRNRTEAVELVSVYAYEDNYGYFNVEGEVRNVATRAISSVIVYFDILDAWGNVVASQSLYVDPYYLEIGETGTFYDYYYDDGLMNSVNVTYVEWIVN